MSGGDRYWLAEDCPQCGQKDSPGAWKGARVSGGAGVKHRFSCCSEACLLAYNDDPKRIERERELLRSQRRALDGEIERLSEQLGDMRARADRGTASG